MSYEDFAQPVEIAMRSTFLTARAAARQMTKQGSGVILAFGGADDPVPDYNIGGFQIALHVVEATMLKRAATLEDVGNVAAFVASDRAGTMTAATVNVSAGALIDN